MQMTKSSIEETAANTLHQHGLYSIPVDPVVLASELGVRVNNAKFSEPSMVAMLAKRGNNIWILLDESGSPFRKRFSIAHELGHHFLHLHSDGEMVDHNADLFRVSEYATNDITLERRREIEANQFAAALLMPEQLVMKVWPDYLSVSEMARLFQVSEEAMGYRIASLGLD